MFFFVLIWTGFNMPLHNKSYRRPIRNEVARLLSQYNLLQEPKPFLHIRNAARLSPMRSIGTLPNRSSILASSTKMTESTHSQSAMHSEQAFTAPNSSEAVDEVVPTAILLDPRRRDTAISRKWTGTSNCKLLDFLAHVGRNRSN